MKNFVQPGQVITVKGEASPIISGRVYDRGGIIGVATGSLTAEDIAAGRDEWEMALGGVYSFTAATGYTPAFGDTAQFVNSSGEVAAAGDVAVGQVIDTVGTEVHVLLNGRGEASGY